MCARKVSVRWAVGEVWEEDGKAPITTPENEGPERKRVVQNNFVNASWELK